MDSGFHGMASGLFFSGVGFGILIVSGIPNFLKSIRDSKAHDS